MKLQGYNVELITEFAKQLTWHERFSALSDQMYVTGKQNHKMIMMAEHVDWIITDSPLLQGLMYADNYFPKTFHPFVHELFKSYDNHNFIINRVKDYNPSGRNQTLDEAKEIDTKVRKLLTDSKEKFSVVDGDEYAPKQILSIIKAGHIHDRKP